MAFIAPVIALFRGFWDAPEGGVPHCGREQSKCGKSLLVNSYSALTAIRHLVADAPSVAPMGVRDELKDAVGSQPPVTTYHFTPALF